LAARRPAAQGKAVSGFLFTAGMNACSTPRMDNFLAAGRAFSLDKKAKKMVKLEIRSRAKKWCVERSLKTKQLAIGNWQLAGKPKTL
jgi:hypothetical protein